LICGHQSKLLSAKPQAIINAGASLASGPRVDLATQSHIGEGISH